MLEEVLFVLIIVGILSYTFSCVSAIEIVSDTYSVDSFSIGQVSEYTSDSDYESRYILPVDSGGYFESDLVYGEVKKFPDDTSLIETPASTPSSGGGGGGESSGGGGVATNISDNMCYTSSDCPQGYSCIDGLCVSVYELNILDFESPGRLGENFEFRYSIKRLLNISGDVKTTYWVQDMDGNIVGYGTDELFLEENEKRTDIGTFELYDKVRDGSYDFYVRVDDKNISLIESVPIVLNINGNLVYINKRPNWPIVIAVSFVFTMSVIIFVVFNDRFIALWYWFRKRYLNNWLFRIKEYFGRIKYE